MFALEFFSVVLPLLFADLIARFLQFAGDLHLRDKTLWFIVIATLEVVAFSVILMVFNSYSVEGWVFLLWTAAVLVGALQYSIDARLTDNKMSKVSSVLLCLLISSVCIFVVSYWGLGWL